MGTQQVLLIVLGVIVVGAAIAVGIAMFNNNAYSANQSALISEINELAVLAFQYWKMPTSLGGFGQDPDNVTMETVASFLGFVEEESKMVVLPDYNLESPNGTHKLDFVMDDEIMIFSLGKEERSDKKPHISSVINMGTGETEIDISAAADF
jgi:hypothetical protein